jgi:hypothetical protein
MPNPCTLSIHQLVLHKRRKAPIFRRIATLIFFTLLSAGISTFAQATDPPKATHEISVIALSDNDPSTPLPVLELNDGTSVEALSATSDETGTQVASDQAQGNSQEQQTPPADNSQAPSLQDLGLSPALAQSDPQLQARLDKRSHMLKIHQRIGLIATIPLIATVATSFGAAGKSTSSTDRWAHLALGSATGDLYFTSAYFAIFAPRIPGTQTHGQIRLHKALAWVHGPGMILTPILGAIAFDQKSKGERVHGIASAHAPIAVVTAGAYVAAILSVSIKF